MNNHCVSKYFYIGACFSSVSISIIINAEIFATYETIMLNRRKGGQVFFFCVLNRIQQELKAMRVSRLECYE